VQALVQEILTPNPAERPALTDILAHEWFTAGCVPPRVPVTAHDSVPDFSMITRSQSAANLAMLRRNALLDEDQAAPIATPEPAAPSGRSAKNHVSSSLAQQEKEFQHAVQPGSPISALLRSARQPLVVAPGAGNKPRESPLLRKLQAAAKDGQRGSPLKKEIGREPLTGIGEEAEEAEAERVKGRRERDYEEVRRKELESQKARIVAQMAPARAESPDAPREERENVPPAGILRKDKGKEKAMEVEEPVQGMHSTICTHCRQALTKVEQSRHRRPCQLQRATVLTRLLLRSPPHLMHGLKGAFSVTPVRMPDYPRNACS
jgi:cell cycle serine/threonine-protein kinase CDC5/MSD2